MIQLAFAPRCNVLCLEAILDSEMVLSALGIMVLRLEPKLYCCCKAIAIFDAACECVKIVALNGAHNSVTEIVVDMCAIVSSDVLPITILAIDAVF